MEYFVSVKRVRPRIRIHVAGVFYPHNRYRTKPFPLPLPIEKPGKRAVRVTTYSGYLSEIRPRPGTAIELDLW